MNSNLKLLFGVTLIFLIFGLTAGAFGSVRGGNGILVGLIVAAATIAVARIMFSNTWCAAAISVGVARAAGTGLLIALAVGGAMITVIPLFLLSTGSELSIHAGSFSISGLFFQAGIAEEILFRGFIFGQLRRESTFWKAASLSCVPFVFVHLALFVSLPWQIAAASIALALVLSFPLARLYELSGFSIWPPAIIHFVIQGVVKVFEFSGESAAVFPLVWMIAAAIIPCSVFLVPIRPRTG